MLRLLFFVFVLSIFSPSVRKQLEPTLAKYSTALGILFAVILVAFKLTVLPSFIDIQTKFSVDQSFISSQLQLLNLAIINNLVTVALARFYAKTHHLWAFYVLYLVVLCGISLTAWSLIVITQSSSAGYLIK